MIAPRRKYDSPAMRDRRQRILAEVRTLLEEDPLGAFTMRDIGRRADVAHRTLYNMFGSKEDVVTAAIEEHFLDALAKAQRPTSTDLLEAPLQHIEARSRQVIGLKPYAAAMVAVFFSPSIDRRIHDSLFRLTRATYDAWLDEAAARKVIRAPSPAEREVIIAFIANSAFANIADVLAERTSPEQYILRGQILFLTVVRPFVQKAHRAAADRRLAELHAANEAVSQSCGS